MQTFITTTGFGYIIDIDTHINCKCELSASHPHPIKDGFTFVEVADKAALDAIELYVPEKTNREYIAALIADDVKTEAEKNIKNKGYVDDDGNVTQQGKDHLKNK